MTKRFVLPGLLAALVVLAICPAAMAAPLPPAPAPDAATVTPLPVDPLLGGDLETTVPTAEQCANTGQCAGIAYGTPCDAPQGCVCYNPPGPTQHACGRP